MAAVSNPAAGPRVLAVVFALVLLDVSLSFHNVWPTPAVSWAGEVSVELAVCLAVMAIVSRWWGPLTRVSLRWLAACWVLLVIGRYADVTAPALYGREVNLYRDLRYVPAVTAMLSRVASLWQVLLALMVAILVPLLLYALFRWCLGRVSEVMGRSRERRWVGWLAAAAVALFVAQRVSALPAVPRFSAPVTQSYWRQARLLATGLTGRSTRALGPSPSFDSDLSRVRGADVVLMFLESYGAVSYDRPEIAGPLAASRDRLEADIRATGRDVVSAYVESPTFGGNSWLAHISLLSGIEVRDEDTNVALMAQKRDTLVSMFARHGYRTVAVMPGLQQIWPEGQFYGFGEIYGETRLDYRGPPFGWWNVPDQFTMARMDALELARQPRAPVFVFFPTIATHTPFSPTPPYQPDWNRVLTDEPFEQADIDRAWLESPDWFDLGPSYVNAFSYTYASIGGYLRMRADRDLVMILIGDHQPPAAVSGEQAGWEVPVHIVASRKDVIATLLAHGFRAGLTPIRPALSRMHALVPILLDAFGSAGS
jgi:Sulfatase